MKQYYESEVLFQLMERDGLNIPSSVPPYEAEIKAYLINQVKQAYPKLTDYEAEWLLYNYTKHLPAEFPISSATDVITATFENVVPFAYQNAILKGQTLVNLLEQSSVGCSYDSKTGIYTSTKNEWVEPVKTSQNVNANVAYTLFAKVNTTTDNIYIRLDYNGGSVAIDPIINGSVKPNSDIFIKTTVVFSKNERIRFVLRNTYGGIVKISNIMLIEGDYTNQGIRFFEGMQSVKMAVLTTTGKNLFDEEWESGSFNNTTGVEVPDSNTVRSKNYISVEPNKNYTFDVNAVKVYYDREYNFITVDTTVSNTNRTITVPSNCHYIRIRMSYNDYASNNLTKQFEKGYTSTSYEPFKSNILTVNEDVELRGIGEVQDTLDLMTGELTQRVSGLECINQNSKLSQSGTSSDTTLVITVSLTSTSTSGRKLASPHELIKYAQLDNWYGNLSIIFRLPKSNENFATLEKFKQYLTRNPFYYYRELEQNEISIKTVELTTVNENGESVHFMPLEGTMNVQSSGEIIPPTFDMSVPVEATTQNLASFIDLQMEE